MVLSPSWEPYMLDIILNSLKYALDRLAQNKNDHRSDAVRSHTMAVPQRCPTRALHNFHVRGLLHYCSIKRSVEAGQ
jgi:hypothetical protein